VSTADEVRRAFKKNTLNSKPLELPELGITVHVRKLSAYYSRRLQELAQIKNVDGAQYLVVDAVTQGVLKFAHGVVTEDNEPIFTEDEAKELAQDHAELFERVIEAVDEISEFDPEVIEAEEARFPESETGEEPGEAEPAAAGDRGPDADAPTGTGDGDAG
jgi:hypothetical protein